MLRRNLLGVLGAAVVGLGLASGPALAIVFI